MEEKIQIALPWINRLNNELILQGVTEEIREVLIAQAILESGWFNSKNSAWSLSKKTNCWGMTYTPRRHKKNFQLGKMIYADFDTFEEGIRDRLIRDKVTFTHTVTKTPIKGTEHLDSRASYIDYLRNSNYAEAKGYAEELEKITDIVNEKKWAKVKINEFYGVLLLLLVVIFFLT
jgi:hypothetical protein